MQTDTHKPGPAHDRDVADPHPSNEEHYDRQEHPGGARPPTKDLGPNDAIHDGEPAKRPPPRPGAPG